MSDDFLELIHADPWVDRLVDLPSLNAAVSDAIEARVLQTRKAARTEGRPLPSSSMVFLGPPGVGKTHLFARLRKKLGPRAVFVHIRPILHGALTPGFVLAQVMRQLSQSSFGVMQLESLVGSLLAYSRGENPEFPSFFIGECRSLDAEEREQRLLDLVDRLCGNWPDIDENFLERLIRTPFVNERERRALVAWLSGEDCDPSQLARIGANASLTPERWTGALRTLSTVAAVGAPLVIAFDQLENLVSRDSVEERVHQYGNLVAELVDSTRGVTLTQFALDSEWARGIDPLFNVSQRSRVAMSVGQLGLPDAQQRIELLRLWHGQLSGENPQFPWPFEADQLKQLGDMFDATPRILLTAFREARAGLPIAVLTPSADKTSSGESDEDAEVVTENSLDDQFQSALVEAHLAIDVADRARVGVSHERLLDGLLGLSEILGWKATSGRDPVQLRIVGSRGKLVEIALLHQGHPRSLAAILQKLVLANSKSLVLVREQWREFLPTWKESNQRLTTLTKAGTPFLRLLRAETAMLLAVDSLLQSARSGDVTDGAGRSLASSVVVDYLKNSALVASADVTKSLAAILNNTGELAAVVEPDTVSQEASLASSVAPLHEGLRVVLVSLQNLRVASVDRLVREVKRHAPKETRASVVAALSGLDTKVEWFGRNIVAVRRANV